MSSSYLDGLPPLPKSLSGFNVCDFTRQGSNRSSCSLSSCGENGTYVTASSHSALTGSSREVTPSSSFSARHTPPPRATPPPPPPRTTTPRTTPGGSPSSVGGGRSAPPPPPPRHHHHSHHYHHHSHHHKRHGRLYSLDNQLSILRKDMFALRQLDLSLLNQLWSLNEAIQEFRSAQELAIGATPPSEDSDDEDYPTSRHPLPLHPQRLPLSLNSSSVRYSRSSSDDDDSSIEYGNV